MTTILRVGDALVVPILPPGQLELRLDGDSVAVKRTIYVRTPLGLPEAPDVVTSFRVPIAALRELLAEGS